MTFFVYGTFELIYIVNVAHVVYIVGATSFIIKSPFF